MNAAPRHFRDSASYTRRYRSSPTTATSGSVGCGTMSRIAPPEPLSRPNGFPARRSTHVAPPPRVPAKRPRAGPARRHRGDHARARLQVHDRALIGSRVVQTQAFLPRAHEDGPPVACALIVAPRFPRRERQRGDPGGARHPSHPGGGLRLERHLLGLHVVHGEVEALAAAAHRQERAAARVARATSAGHGPPPGSAGSTSAPSESFLVVRPADGRHRIAGAHGSTTRGGRRRRRRRVAVRVFAGCGEDGDVSDGGGDEARVRARRAGAVRVDADGAGAERDRAAAHGRARARLDHLRGAVLAGEREPSRGRARPGAPSAPRGASGSSRRGTERSAARAGLAPATGQGQGVQARAPRRLRDADDPELVRREQPKPALERVHRHRGERGERRPRRARGPEWAEREGGARGTEREGRGTDGGKREGDQTAGRERRRLFFFSTRPMNLCPCDTRAPLQVFENPARSTRPPRTGAPRRAPRRPPRPLPPRMDPTLHVTRAHGQRCVYGARGFGTVCARCVADVVSGHSLDDLGSHSRALHLTATTRAVRARARGARRGPRRRPRRRARVGPRPRRLGRRRARERGGGRRGRGAPPARRARYRPRRERGGASHEVLGRRRRPRRRALRAHRRRRPARAAAAAARVRRARRSRARPRRARPRVRPPPTAPAAARRPERLLGSPGVAAKQQPESEHRRARRRVLQPGKRGQPPPRPSLDGPGGVTSRAYRGSLPGLAPPGLLAPSGLALSQPPAPPPPSARTLPSRRARARPRR